MQWCLTWCCGVIRQPILTAPWLCLFVKSFIGFFLPASSFSLQRRCLSLRIKVVAAASPVNNNNNNPLLCDCSLMIFSWLSPVNASQLNGIEYADWRLVPWRKLLRLYGICLLPPRVRKEVWNVCGDFERLWLASTATDEAQTFHTRSTYDYCTREMNYRRDKIILWSSCMFAICIAATTD